MLLDLQDLSLPDSELTRYDGGAYFARVLYDYRVAACGGRPEMVNHFAETVAQNRGGQLMAFVDRLAAELDPSSESEFGTTILLEKYTKSSSTFN